MIYDFSTSTSLNIKFTIYDFFLVAEEGKPEINLNS